MGKKKEKKCIQHGLVKFVPVIRSQFNCTCRHCVDSCKLSMWSVRHIPETEKKKTDSTTPQQHNTSQRLLMLCDTHFMPYHLALRLEFPKANVRGSHFCESSNSTTLSTHSFLMQETALPYHRTMSPLRHYTNHPVRDRSRQKLQEKRKVLPTQITAHHTLSHRRI